MCSEGFRRAAPPLLLAASLHTNATPVSATQSEQLPTALSTSRLHRLHRRATNAFIRVCQAALISLAFGLLVLIVDGWLLPGTFGAIESSEHPAAQVASGLFWLAVAGLPLLVPWISMLFLVLSLMVGHELDSRELKFAAVALLLCAATLALLVRQTQCGIKDADPQVCSLQALLFIVDQFNHGSFGDVFDVFDISFSSIGFGTLDGWQRLHALNLRMLCAVTVVSLLMRWLGTPLQRLAQLQAVQTTQRSVRSVFLWACYASLICLLCWLLVLPLEHWFFPGYFDRLDSATDLPSQALRVILISLMAGIPVVVSLVSLLHLVLSLLVGHTLRGREFGLASLVLVVCGAGLLLLIEGPACKGLDEHTDACSSEVIGFVFDQFYKGAFADVFDVYELKLGDIDSDSLSVLDKLMILNFRLLCAIYVVGVVVSWSRWRTDRKARKARKAGMARTLGRQPRQPAASVAEPGTRSADDAWAPTVFVDTQPMQPQRH